MNKKILTLSCIGTLAIGVIMGYAVGYLTIGSQQNENNKPANSKTKVMNVKKLLLNEINAENIRENLR